MADLTITAASVVKGAGAVLESGYAGETITAGQPVYKDPTSQLYLRADNNSAVADARKVRGIALANAALNQPLVIQTAGEITIGAAVVKGGTYVLSANVGMICPQADLVSGNDVAIIGVAKTTAIVVLGRVAPGITL